MIDFIKSNYDYVPLNVAPNFAKIPANAIGANEKAAEDFNKIFHWLKEQNWNKITRTPSGGISINRRNLKFPMWDVIVPTEKENLTPEITICGDGIMTRIQFRNITNKISGTKAFKTFRKILNKHDIEIDDYIIENGEGVKKTMPAPLIACLAEELIGETLYDVHHIDFHSSHMAGLANTHPEFRPAIEEVYNNRKTGTEDRNQKYKAILNCSWGYMQSIKYGRKGEWAHLSKDALIDNNNRVLDIRERIEEAGGLPLLFNTDGIWYMADEPYHGEGEGKALGEWENDHVNCQFRMKSKGCYEFIEDGQYHPVIRGQTSLDKIKPRTEWNWGDIYQSSHIIHFYWNDEEGIIIYKEEIENED